MNTKTTQNSIKGRISYFRRKKVLTFRDDKPTVYAIQVVRGPVVKEEDFVAYAAHAAHVPESTIRMAKMALFDAINYFCCNNHSVEVKNLGTFKPELTFKTAKDVESTNTDTIKAKRYHFFPTGTCKNLGTAENINWVENKALSKMACPEEYVDQPDSND